MRPVDAPRLRFIGVVRSPLADPAGAPRQGREGAPDAVLDLDPAVVAGLTGLRPGDEIIVITWLHRASRDVLRTHPRDDATRPPAGVFSLRSQDRPNPLGLHQVTIRAVDGTRLTVGPLEAIDGTPVVDLKPVI